MLCFRKFPMTKKIMDKRGGGMGVSIFSVESFFVPQPGKTLARKPFALFFPKVPVAKKIMDKRGVLKFCVEK